MGCSSTKCLSLYYVPLLHLFTPLEKTKGAMRIHPALLLLTILFGVLLEAHAEADWSNHPRVMAIRLKIHADKRPDALKEAATLPVNVAVPFLGNWIMSPQKQKDSYYDMARETLLNIPGYENYFADKLKTDKAQRIVDGRTFELLSILGTPKIQALLAPYLFDFEIILGHGDIRPSVMAPVAGLALDRMHLSDAPPEINTGLKTAKDLRAWQQWAIRKKLVPPSSKVGVPAGLFGVTDPGAKPL
jgi:hypothetical protein